MAPGIADKKNNTLPLWGNEKTMNLNNLILTNILSSHYFKVNLYQLKTYHEVIDEIYYKVNHLEPWEKGSRKTAGQTGMCGGVRGVGAGGIVSTAFCILYKLFTLKLTRKQVVGLINHGDSPYIRALGFMYIRYTQPPADLWDWYEPYLEDEEEVDVKAGSGQMMSMGEILRHFLSKLEWFSTLFPRIPVPIQKDLERKLSDWRLQSKVAAPISAQDPEEHDPQNADETWDDPSKTSSHSESRHRESDNRNSKEHEKDDSAVGNHRDRRDRRERSPKHRHRHHSNSRKRHKHSSRRSRSRSPRDDTHKHSRSRHPHSRSRHSHSPTNNDQKHIKSRHSRSPVDRHHRSRHRY